MFLRPLIATFAVLALVACDNESGTTVFVPPGGDTSVTADTSVAADTSVTEDVVTGNPWNGAGVSMPATVRDTDGNEVAAISGVHVVGVPPAGSPCPTPLGTLTVVNNSAAAADVGAVTADVVAIGTDPAGTQSVAVGATYSANIFFTCDSTDDIDTMLNVTITNGTESNDFSIPLAVDVQQP